MKKTLLFRWCTYLAGMLVLAFGLSLNARLSLGVSPISAVAYCIAQVLDIDFGDGTLVFYLVLIVVQLLLHLRLAGKGGKGELAKDLIQLPVSLLVTRVMNLFGLFLPNFAEDCAGGFWGGLAGRLVLLLGAILCIGVGSAMALDMRLPPDPGTGIVRAIADTVGGLDLGTSKNCVDGGCLVLTVGMSLLLTGRILGIGIGTVLTMLCVGRVIALFNRKFQAPLLAAAGLER